MIEQKSQHQLNNDPQYYQLTRQMNEYKKINATLKKKIKAKDRQINYLFSYIDQLGTSGSNLDSKPNRGRNVSDNPNRHQIHTEIKKKQKQNVQYLQNNNQQYIFKHFSSRNMIKLGKQEVRLPSLQKKLIVDNQMQQSQKPKVLKIPAQRLVALKPQQVRKKFEMKYGLSQQ